MANANIFQQYLRPPKSVLEYGAEMDQAEGNALDIQGKRSRNELAALSMEQQRGQMADATKKRNAIEQVYMQLGPQATPMARARALQANPLTAAEGVAAEKALIENDHKAAQAEREKGLTDKTAFDLKDEKKRQALADIAALTNPDHARASLEAHFQKGDIDQQKYQAVLATIPTDPAQFPAWQVSMLRNIMSPKDQVAAQHQDATLAESQRSNKTREGLTAAQQAEMARAHRASEGLTARGQNMADARARELASAALSKPFELTGPDGLPVAVQQDKQGKITPVPGYGPKAGASKPLNDTQAKALGFGTRMQESDKIINEIGNDFSPMAVNAKNAVGKAPLIGGLLEAGANAALSPNSQRAEQAQRDFVNAILRRESGAAISDPEFQNARKQYFPQPGDSKALLEQKAANRKLAMEGVLAEVPKGQRGSIGPQAGAAGDIHSQADAILRGSK